MPDREKVDLEGTVVDLCESESRADRECDKGKRKCEETLEEGEEHERGTGCSAHVDDLSPR